jgi:Kef-type K+ transport system membrane component KefB
VEITFTSLAVVVGAGFLAPFALGLVPTLRLPAVVLEIVFGILIGPQVLGWAESDAVVQVVALLGLAFLLLIAGLEVDYDRLRGKLLEITGLAWLVSFGLAIVAGFLLDVGGYVSSPLLIAIMFSATSLGVILPILKDAGELSTSFGRVVLGGCSIAEVATIVLLSLFFSGEGSIGSTLVLLGLFFGLVVAIGIAFTVGEHSMRVSGVFLRLMDTSAQIRVRGAFLLLAIFVVVAEQFGLEAILGAFLAGAILKILDRDRVMTHPEFHHKLEAVGFGIFVPVFFVNSGLRFNLDALFADTGNLVQIPIFVAVLLVARGLPALLYGRLGVGRSKLVAAALMQSTQLGFFVVVTQIGQELDLISTGTASAVIAAGLISVVVFPLGALTILRREGRRAAALGGVREPEPGVA